MHEGNLDIYGLNLTTTQQFPVVLDPGIERFPVIYGNTIIWGGYRNGTCDISWDIYGYNFSTEQI